MTATMHRLPGVPLTCGALCFLLLAGCLDFGAKQAAREEAVRQAESEQRAQVERKRRALAANGVAGEGKQKSNRVRRDRPPEGGPAREGPRQDPPAAEKRETKKPHPAAAPFEEEKDVPPPPPPESKGLIRLTPAAQLWIDAKNKHVVLGGRIAQRRGPMEMFACPKGTKEHESVVAVYSKAYLVHAALLAIGAEAGHPVSFRPKYVAAEGTQIDVTVAWTDAKGKRRRLPAQQWLRNVDTGEAMKYSWVFGGSGFWVSEDGKERLYLAEDGDLICISNFASATLDLPVASSASNEALLYEGFEARIPPSTTPVALILTPNFEAGRREPLFAPPPQKERVDDLAEPVRAPEPVE